jgi:hypothetical protein
MFIAISVGNVEVVKSKRDSTAQVLEWSNQDWQELDRQTRRSREREMEEQREVLIQ